MIKKCEDYKYSSYSDYKFNRGITQTKIMREIFGSKCNYNQLFEESFEMRFIDVLDTERKLTNEYILEGMMAFKKEQGKNMIEILSNRDVFKDLICYLKEICKIKYVEIKDFFEISRGTMDSLKNIKAVFEKCPQKLLVVDN